MKFHHTPRYDLETDTKARAGKEVRLCDGLNIYGDPCVHVAKDVTPVDKGQYWLCGVHMGQFQREEALLDAGLARYREYQDKAFEVDLMSRDLAYLLTRRQNLNEIDLTDADATRRCRVAVEEQAIERELNRRQLYSDPADVPTEKVAAHP